MLAPLCSILGKHSALLDGGENIVPQVYILLLNAYFCDFENELFFIIC
jgi:hypothetical protein